MTEAPDSVTYELRSGHVVLVDKADEHLLGEYKWRPKPDRHTVYVHAHTYLPDGRRTTVQLHRLIMCAEPGRLVDHANRNGLDNRRANLRLATASQNAGNYRLPQTNRSGRKGVSWSTTHHAWHAQIRVSGATVHLGYFSQLDEAALAYDHAAVDHFGPFALTNALLLGGVK